MTNGIKKQVKNYHSDIELSGSGNTDYGHALADRILKQTKKEGLEKKIKLENYFAFVSAIKKSRINIENKFADRQIKEEFMKKYFNYPTLKGFRSWASCPDYAVGSAFKNNYHSALDKIKKGMMGN